MEQINRAINSFEQELRSSYGCADSTVRTYLRELRALEEDLRSHQRSLLSANRKDFLQWRDRLGVREPSGQRLAVVVARSFYNFATDSKIIRQNRFPIIKVKVKKQQPADVPTVEQFLLMRQAAGKFVIDKRGLKMETRRALLETLAGAGLRIDALLTLRPSHLCFGTRPHIMVNPATMACKGSIAGEIPISPYCAQILKQYIESEQIETNSVIFPYSESVVRKIIKELQPESIDLHPHSMRHFYCSMCYFRNFDGGRSNVIWVRDAAGHASITTTDGYLRMAQRVVQTEAQWESWACGVYQENVQVAAVN